MFKILLFLGLLFSTLSFSPLFAESNPSLRVKTCDERVQLPVFDATKWAFKKGYTPRGIRAMECATKGALVGETVKLADAEGRTLVKDVDWILDDEWGVIGLKDGARVVDPVNISYEYRLKRIDSVVVDVKGEKTVLKGIPHITSPRPPALPFGTRLVENLLISEDRVEHYPVLEGANLAPRTPEGAVKTLPRFMAKLANGEPVKILAWGDSVTECLFLPEKCKWQRQFVERLRAKYTKSAITLLENGWGGRTTKAFLEEPKGSKHNFKETVLALKPDLVISEFVNDAHLPEADFLATYPKLLSDFRADSIEWVVMTPHYVRPDWMELTSSKNCDDDPRPYVKFLRSFAAENNIGLADASLRWGHLYREGIPYETMFVNSINHPVEEGMGYYVDALLDFFGIQRTADDKPLIERRKPLTANVGVVSVGLDTYWKQCPGLLEDMQKKEDVFVRKLEGHQVKVSRFGMSDNPIAAQAKIAAMKAADLDVLFVDMVTYATSSTFAPFVRELNVPIVLFCLQPDDSLDYEHATIYRQLLNDDLCSIPEFTGVAIRYGKPVADVVIGKLEGDGRADEEIRQWCAVAHVLHDLRRARFGLMGHVLEAMYDMQVDPTAVSRTFGCHISLCEPEMILPYYREPDLAAVDAMKKRILSFFDTPDPVSDPWTEKLTDHDLEVAAKAACALEKFIDARRLDGFAYYYEGEAGSMTRELVTNFIVGNSLLTAAGFPMCGEFDLKNCVAMMIFDRLEIGGSFAEFHPIDFGRDTVLVGHDGPHHLNIAQSKPVLRSLKKYHGKPGKGAGVEFNIKEGPITMMSLGLKADGQFKFIVAEGESLKGPIPPTGNTNTHGSFKPDVRTFLRSWAMEGPTHHFALGVGHHAAELKKLGRALGIETVVVTPEN